MKSVDLWGDPIVVKEEPKAEKIKKPTPFVYLESIMNGKNNIMLGDDSDMMNTSYDSWMVNRGLSQNIDCLLDANEMNMYWEIDPRMQYDYLFHSIRKMKRYSGKWAKAETSDAISIIIEYYKYTRQQAERVSRLFTSDMLSELKQRLQDAKGGA